LAVSRNPADVASRNRTGLVHRRARHGSQKKALAVAVSIVGAETMAPHYPEAHGIFGQAGA